MLLAQLAAFLTAHHHAIWAARIAVNSHTFAIAYHWATLHGFAYQP